MKINKPEKANMKKLLIDASKATLILLMFIVHQSSQFSLRPELGMLEAMAKLKNWYPDSGNEANGVCYTDTCIKEAARVMNSLDENVDPCKDFYQFTCGGWMNQNSLPNPKNDIQNSKNVIQEQESTQLNRIKAMIRQPPDQSDSRWMKILRTYYKSCMDIKTIYEIGIEPLREVINMVGGWPVVEGEEWDEAGFNWIDTLLKIRHFGGNIDSIFSLSVKLSDDGTRSFLAIEPPKFQKWKNTTGFALEAPDWYLKKMVNIAKYMGATNESSVEEELSKSIHFEQKLIKVANGSSGNVFRTNIENVKEIIPKVDWLGCIRGVTRLNMTDKYDVFTNLTDISFVVAELEKIDKRTLANYMIWRVLEELVHYLPDRAVLGVPRSQWHMQSSSGVLLERHDFCAERLRDLDILLLREYVTHYSVAYTREAILEMTENVQEQLRLTMETCPWIKKGKTRRALLEKVDATRIDIVFPPEILNDTLLSAIFGEFELKEKEFLGNIWRIRKFYQDFELTRQLTGYHKWEIIARNSLSPPTAHNIPSLNTIQILLGYTEGILFNEDRPQYMNYGALGVIIGHEFGHGYENNGLDYDKFGHETSMLDYETAREFARRTKCMVQQYHNFTYKELEMNIDGFKTLDENIADHVGTKLSYKAYLDWTHENKPEPTLPGLTYSAEQMFWISFANVWCGKFGNNAMADRLTTDTHSQIPYRVNGCVSNSKDFAKDFHCPVGSPMNPYKKCSIW